MSTAACKVVGARPIQYLQMGVSGHQVLLLVVRTLDHHVEKSLETLLNVVDIVQKPEAHIGCDLVISGPTRVQLSS
jgi:hypothetical protein